MIIRKIESKEKDNYNQVIKHIFQTWEWGEFKEKVGMEAIRLGVFDQGKLVDGYLVLTRELPKFGYKAGQVLKCSLPGKKVINAFRDLCQKENIAFLVIEPEHVVRRWKNRKGKVHKTPAFEKPVDLSRFGLEEAQKKLFATYTFIVDLSQSDKEIINNMHSKTRYNIRLAKRKGVEVVEKSDEEGLEIFTQLLAETMKREGFYLHNKEYYQKLWQVLGPKNKVHILLAKYQGEVLAAWVVLNWKDHLYYPYGASSTRHRDLMASNLVCWQAIKLGKELGCQSFDLLGSLGPKPDKTDSWYGFHRFKKGYGGDLVEFAGSWDLVVNPLLHRGVHFANNLRWKWLNLRSKLPF